MQLIRGLTHYCQEASNAILTIGNFDGVHLGHQRLIERLKQLQAHSQPRRPVVVMLFEPHPLEWFSGPSAPARLSSLRDKLILLEQLGVDKVVCLRFDATLAAMSADDFVEQVLHQHLRVQHVVVGEDFQFGHQRKGNVASLRCAGERLGFKVEAIPLAPLAKQKISSTRVRECLARADMQAAQQCLGRPYQISGRVRYGQQRGRELGFPTINIAWPFKQASLHGIYAVKVLGLADHAVAGAASVGCRPTVGGQDWNIEVYCFDYNEQCYGKSVTIQFLQWFREEEHFSSLEALQQQMADDVRKIKQYFNSESESLRVNKVIEHV